MLLRVNNAMLLLESDFHVVSWERLSLLEPRLVKGSLFRSQTSSAFDPIVSSPNYEM